MRLPRENTWRSVQGSDMFGDIMRSRNVDLSETGYVTLSKKPCCIFNNVAVAGTGDVDFDDVIAIAADDTYYYFIAADGKNTGATISETALTFADINTSGAPTVVVTSDATSYNSAIAVSGSTDLRYLASFDGTANSGTWTTASDFSFGTNPHPLCKIEHRNTLAIGDGNKVYQTDAAAWTDDDTNILTIPVEYVVTSMRWRGNKLYIGTRNVSGGNAMLFVWGGTGTSADYGWPVDAGWIYSVCEYGSSVAVLTSAGQLLYFNGGGFQVLANLPVFYTPFTWHQNATGQNTRGKAVNRSMWAIGDTIYLNIEGEPRGADAPENYKQPGGLWIFDPAVGLYHRAGYTAETYRILTISSLASNIFNFSSAHGVSTGDAVWAHTVTNIDELTAGRVYYAVVESSTAFKLALSPADAHAGRTMLASGTVSGDKLAVETLDVLGATQQLIPGPVHGFSRLQPSKFFATEVFFAGKVWNTLMNSNEATTLMSFGMGRNVGYFVTPKLYGQHITDTFQKIVANIRGLNLDTDKVVIKFRTRERFGLPTPIRVSGLSANWTDDSNFTIDTATKDVRSAQVGDEVEFTQGAAAGYTAHITAIDDSTSTWTITLDEDVPGIAASDRSDFIIDNWTKLGTFTNTSNTIDQGFLEQLVGNEGAWCQFKIEMRGTGVAINMLDVISTPAKLAV